MYFNNFSYSRFVTFTGNPKWPEIQEALSTKQSYTSRMDIVCRIFMNKAEEFIKDLVEKNVLGRVSGWCYSVEHQKRGNCFGPELIFSFKSVCIRHASHPYAAHS